jgi:hypothetical protein
MMLLITESYRMCTTFVWDGLQKTSEQGQQRKKTAGIRWFRMWGY